MNTTNQMKRGCVVLDQPQQQRIVAGRGRILNGFAFESAAAGLRDTAALQRHLWEVFTDFPRRLCDLAGVKTFRTGSALWLLGIFITGSVMPIRAETNEMSTNAVAAATPEPETMPAAASDSGPQGFTAFKVVGERNIFNGNRSGQRMTATRNSTQQRSVRVESFSLVGTLLSEDKEPVAFFDGSSSEFRHALKKGGSIAGFTVKEILHAGVRLGAGTNTMEVLVGTGLRREDAGLWKTSTASTSYASSSSSGSNGGSNLRPDNGNGGRTFSRGNRGGRGDSESSASSSPASSASSADAAEILKRLMEKREKE